MIFSIPVAILFCCAKYILVDTLGSLLTSQSMISVPESLLDLCAVRIVSLSSCQEQGVCRGDGEDQEPTGSHVAGKIERFLMITISLCSQYNIV